MQHIGIDIGSTYTKYCVMNAEHKIIELRYFQGKTQMEVSTEVGISQAQVSRLEKSALEQIRRGM